MPTQIDCMRDLLAGLDGRRLHGALRERQGQNYAARNFLGTLMRYFLFPVPRLADRQPESSIARLLVVPDRLRPLLSTRRLAAPPAAVLVAVVTATAQEEDLS